MRAKVESEVVAHQNRRLQQLLAFLEAQSVSLCVFPEYALVAHESTLDILNGFASTVSTVAGLGMPKAEGIQALRRYTDDGANPHCNLVAVFSQAGCSLVAKKHPASGEEITPGEGIRVVPIELKGQRLNLAVAICKDYLAAGHNLDGFEDISILAVPAFSFKANPFEPDAARDFPRLFANAATAGGSTVFAAGLEGPLVEHRRAKAISPGSEAILAVRWSGQPQAPTGLREIRARITLRAGIVSTDTSKDVREIVEAFGDRAPAPYGTEMEEHLARWIQFLENRPDHAVVLDAVNAYRVAAANGTLSDTLRTLLTTHAFIGNSASLGDLRTRAVGIVAAEIRRLLKTVDEASDTYLGLLRAAQHYRDPSTTHSDPGPPASEGLAQEKCYFSLQLGKYDTANAVRSLDAQLDLMLAFAGSAPGDSRIEYCVETREDPASGSIAALYSISFFGPDDAAGNEYFAGLERIARSIYLRAWSVSAGSPRPIHDSGAPNRSIVWLQPRAGEPPRARTDWGLLVDILRATGPNCMIQFSARRTNDKGNFEYSASRSDDKSKSTDDPATWFETLVPGELHVALDTVVATPERNDALASLIGTVFWGPGNFSIDDSAGDARVVPVEYAMRILHPPHGEIKGRGLRGEDPLRLLVQDVTLPSEGALLGTATQARPFIDREVAAMLSDEDRLLHTYVVGRTGSGKTNTLKNIARHDIRRDTAVIVIDPHGDLYDYCLRHTTHREALIALDFSDPDSAPSINPLYLDADSEDDVSFNIDELISLFVRSGYHEFYGPRFSDILRLCIETSIVAAEVAGGYAQLLDVASLVEDREFRAATLKLLESAGRHDLRRRWALHTRMRETEQAEVEQWFVSKFSEFRRSPAFAAATSGPPTVSLRSVLSSRGCVLVKVPWAQIGEPASRFLGSLLVARVMRYTLQGIFGANGEPASLIVDEFQNFVGDAFTKLLAEARKFGLGLTIAHQTLSQLVAFSSYEGLRSDALLQVVLGNVGNLVIQSIAHDDARRLSSELGIEESALRRIARHSAVLALTHRGTRLAPFTAMLSDSGDFPGPTSFEASWARAQGVMRAASRRPARFAAMQPLRDARSDVSGAEVEGLEMPAIPATNPGDVEGVLSPRLPSSGPGDFVDTQELPIVRPNAGYAQDER